MIPGSQTLLLLSDLSYVNVYVVGPAVAVRNIEVVTTANSDVDCKCDIGGVAASNIVIGLNFMKECVIYMYIKKITSGLGHVCTLGYMWIARVT